MATGVTLSGANNWAFQIDGLITLTSDGSFGGNAFMIKHSTNVEVFSSNNLGAINGQGYIMRTDGTDQNARLLRFYECSDLSVHNLILVDSPTFHLIFNEVSNLEAYYITIRGPDLGGTDGIDLQCTDNCYLHDFEVTNRDECVSVKAPSNNVLIEDAYCNHSGGMSIGSLSADVDDVADAPTVSNITMKNIYSYKSTQMLMIKTWPGGDGATGYVTDSDFENFWSYDCTYGLDIDQCTSCSIKYIPHQTNTSIRLVRHDRSRHRRRRPHQPQLQELDRPRRQRRDPRRHRDPRFRYRSPSEHRPRRLQHVDHERRRQCQPVQERLRHRILRRRLRCDYDVHHVGDFDRCTVRIYQSREPDLGRRGLWNDGSHPDLQS